MAITTNEYQKIVEECAAFMDLIVTDFKLEILQSGNITGTCKLNGVGLWLDMVSPNDSALKAKTMLMNNILSFCRDLDEALNV